MVRCRSSVALAAVLLATLVSPAFASGPRGQLSVVSVSPAARSLTAGVGESITVNFDRPVERSSIVALESFWAFGRWSGTVSGVFEFSNGDQTVTLNPDRPFSAGEWVMVILSHDIQATDSSFLRSAGYSFQFWTRAGRATRSFEEIVTLSTNANGGESSRPYGGIATDLDGDRFLDLTMVNEDTTDLRVFMNPADGTLNYSSFLQPTSPLLGTPSPSEPTDFNRDGLADICVGNGGTSTVSVLLGNGDGSFAAQQLITVGSNPRGITVLDADGDGDVDIVNANHNSNNLSLLLNDGTGSFSFSHFFDAGGNGEWAIGAADMTEDGILDLVVGTRTGQTMHILRCNGDATFTPLSSRSSGGATWQLALGDLDGDGHEDVAVGNSFSDNGGVLLGNGDGTFQAVTTYPTDPFNLAVDVGDIDGDGDLDWLCSSFSGDWTLFTNDGSGAFSEDQQFIAPAAASCALMADIDNDLDLDLALIDEIADTICVLRNRNLGPGAVPTLSEWGLLVLASAVFAFGGIVAWRRR